MSAMARTPPTVPPAIAPALEVDFEDEALDVEEGLLPPVAVLVEVPDNAEESEAFKLWLFSAAVGSQMPDVCRKGGLSGG